MSAPHLVNLGAVADFVNGVAFQVDDWGSKGRPIIRIQNLNDPDKPFNRTTRKVAERNLARKGDLLVSWAASLGVYEWQGEEACVNQHIFKVIPRSDRVHHQYLRHALQASIGAMEAKVHGATMKHITRDKFLGIEIPLPCIDEQRRIATILDKVTALRGKRLSAVRLADRLPSACFEQAFGANITAGPMVELANVTSLITKGTTPTTLGFPFADDGVPFLRVQNLVGAKVELADALFVSVETHSALARSKIESADVLISIAGTIGRAAIVSEDMPEMNCNQAIAIVRPSPKIEPQFLLHWLQSREAQKQIRAGQVTGTISNLSLGLLRGLKIDLPPINMQRDFNSTVLKIEVVKERLRAALLRVEVLQSALQQRAFAGAL